jgi:hypothetical protein
MDFSAMSVVDAMTEVAVMALIGFGFYYTAAPRSRVGRMAAILGLILFVAGIFFFDLYTYSEEPIRTLREETFLRQILGLFGIQEVQLGAAITAVLLGWGAHWFKRINRLWYGICEVLFGIAAAFESSKAFAQHGPALAAWIALGGSAYIVERGLNNRREAAIAAGAKPADDPPKQVVGDATVQPI